MYQAVREADGQQVALKIVMPRAAVGEDEYHAVLVAMDRVRPLRHPHVAALLDCGLAGCGVYFVTEYCDGGNLQQWVDQRGGWRSFTEVGPLLMQCLDALEYAHAHDVIHRGIHPQNVLLSGQATLTPCPSPKGRGEIATPCLSPVARKDRQWPSWPISP